VEKEAELEESEMEYIRQVDMKEINEEQFRELVGELDMERAMAESVAEGPASVQATMQDKEVGESEWEKSAEKAPEVVAVVVESSTISKGKRKAAPAKAKVYAEVEGSVSRLSKSMSIHTNTSSHSVTDV
jgi:phage I-like protein